MNEAPKENQCRFTSEDMGGEDCSDDKWLEQFTIAFFTASIIAMIGITILGFFHLAGTGASCR